MGPSARCGDYTWPVLGAYSIWKSFPEYEQCPGICKLQFPGHNCKLQFPGHHSYIRTDIQMLFAVKIKPSTFSLFVSPLHVAIVLENEDNFSPSVSRRSDGDTERDEILYS